MHLTNAFSARLERRDQIEDCYGDDRPGQYQTNCGQKGPQANDESSKMNEGELKDRIDHGENPEDGTTEDGAYRLVDFRLVG